MSSCRYASGQCELQNGDVRVQLTLADEATWQLSSEVGLAGAMIGGQSHAQPVAMSAASANGTVWQLSTSALPVQPTRSLRLVVAVDQSQYFAEFPAAFLAQD